MKKYFLMLIALLFFTACSTREEQKEQTTSFTAIIEKVNEKYINVTTLDAKDVSFDNADVNFDNELTLNFELEKGQKVNIEILPQILERFPVQVTAVNITKIE